MTRFHYPGVDVNVSDVLIRRREAEEYSGEVVSIQFRSALARALYAYPRTKELEMLQVWLAAGPTLVGSGLRNGVYATIVHVDCMENGGGPVFRREGGAIEQRAYGDGESIVPSLDASVLRSAISPRGLYHIVVVVDGNLPEVVAFG